MLNEKKVTLICALIALTITALIAWLTPIAFCGYRVDDRTSVLWLSLSNSGGALGTSVIILTTGVLLALCRQTIKQKLATFFAFIVTIVATLGILAYVNEFVTKPQLKVSRPSHKYLEKKGVIAISLTAFYKKSKEERRRYLSQEIRKQREKLAYIDPDVLKHWTLEAGFSCPSGHSLNAFFLGVILCYLLCCTMSSKLRYFICPLPLLWSVSVCLSRVALGVHSALDVSVGGAIGILLAASMLSVFDGCFVKRVAGSFPA